MKSEIKGNIKPVDTYPCLKEYARFNNHIVVLFSKHDTGMVVYADKLNENIGWVKGYFSEIWGEDEFSNFEDELVLKNE